MIKRFTIEVLETRSRLKTVDAENSKQALGIVQQLYIEDRIILNTNDFVDVQFKDVSEVNK